MSKSVPYGVNCLYVYNKVNSSGLIKVLYAIHTVSGNPYVDVYISLDKIIETTKMNNWMVQAGNT